MDEDQHHKTLLSNRIYSLERTFPKFINLACDKQGNVTKYYHSGIVPV